MPVQISHHTPLLTVTAQQTQHTAKRRNNQVFITPVKKNTARLRTDMENYED